MKAGVEQSYAELGAFIKGLKQSLSAERCRLINKKTQLVYLNEDAEALNQSIRNFEKKPSAEGFIEISDKVDACRRDGIGKFPNALLSQLNTFKGIATKEMAARNTEPNAKHNNRPKH